MNALRAGLSGCARFLADEHQTLLLQHDCDLVALHDDDRAALFACAAMTGITLRAHDYAALLATGVDFVVLRGAHHLAERAAAAAEQGAHVFVHHDALDGGADCDALAAVVAACEQHDLRLGFGAPLLHDPALHDLRALLASGAIGALTELQLCGAAPLGAFVPLAAWLTGRPARSVRMQNSGGSPRATLQLAGDATVQLACTPHAASSVTVHGTEGWCIVQPERCGLQTRTGWNGNVIASNDPGQERWIERDASAETQARGRAEPHGTFARWIEECDVFPCPGEQLVEDLRTLRALEASQRSGQDQAVLRR